MYAIVRSGSKQYKVKKGDIIDVELLDAEPGKKVNLEVVMLADNGKVEVDADKLASKHALAKVIEHKKDKKVIVFKMHKRKRYQRTKGHRQNFTRIEIDSIPAFA